MGKTFFITGTDTDIGKTMTTAALGVRLKEEGYDVGVMKPVQCSGTDAEFLANLLDCRDAFHDINPYFAKEPISPHLAFARTNKKISIPRIYQSFRKLKKRHGVLLIEGAGGLMVPIKPNYFMADLIRELEAEVIIVSRLGLGTINHTLLTIQQARDYGLVVRGVLFNEARNTTRKLVEQTNPAAIEKFGNVKILGTIPYMRRKKYEDFKKINKKRINLKYLFTDTKVANEELAVDDKKYIWHPFTQMKDWLSEEPLIIDEARDNYLIDTRGNKYLDGVSSLWVNVHGHRQSLIDQRIKDQVNKISHSTLLGLSNTPSIELARKLAEITPKGLEKVFYSDNGSTAVEIAIKMAYQFWQNCGKTKKNQIAHLDHAYHGDTLGSVSVGGIDLFHKTYRNLMFKTISIPFPDCYRSPKGKQYPDYAFESLRGMKKLFREKHRSIAAFICEPIVQGAAGMIVWPKGVLKEMQELCRKYDILMIVDEVATGFGRTGTMFACQQESVLPDIMCLAKGLTGGYLPLAATITNKRVYDGFLYPYEEMKTFFHGHTYTGNPLACAAAIANLEVFKSEHVLEKLRSKIKYLAKELKMFYNLAHVGDVRQLGFMVGIELVSNRDRKKPYDWKEKIGVQVCQKVRERGVILRPLGNVIVLMPPLSMSIQELDDLLEVTYWAIRKVTDG